MDYNTLDIELIKEIPEIKQYYDEELESWDEKPGQHNIFGNVLNPFLIELLRINKNSDLIKRIFYFLEKMAVCNDLLVREVLGCTVLERLGDDKVILQKAVKYMGEKTKKMSSEIELGWGRF